MGTADDLQRLERLAKRMDSALRVPGTGIRLGADSILGLIPGIGDALTLAPAGWIIWRAHKMGAPRHILGRMTFNAAVDSVIGTIPLIGDLFDIGWRGNLRNVRLLRKHLEEPARLTATSPSNA